MEPSEFLEKIKGLLEVIRAQVKTQSWQHEGKEFRKLTLTWIVRQKSDSVSAP